MTRQPEPGAAETSLLPDPAAPPRHEIERAVQRLNEWFAANKTHLPTWFHWRRGRRVRTVPVFRAVPTTQLQGWAADDLRRLFRVLPQEVWRTDHEVERQFELLVADKSGPGEFLEVGRLMRAVRAVITSGRIWRRCSPRLWWFWFNSPWFTREIESYVQGIRLRLDGQTPVPKASPKVFEAFVVPLENGQQTAVGQSCLFVLEYVEPQGVKPYWRFSVTQHDVIVVPSQPLRPKPIYLEEELLAVIKKIDDTTVTLSVVTSEGILT